MAIKNSTKDEKCNCINSWLSPHRKSKCLLNNTFNQFNGAVFTPVTQEKPIIQEKPITQENKSTGLSN